MESNEVESRSNRMPPQGIGPYFHPLRTEGEPARTGFGLYLFILSCEGEPEKIRMDS